ncbi:hypothetical protein Tco_0692930 [Tanacetum coccineum]
MIPPNNLGLDLNGKAINKTQYRGMIGKLMYLTVSIPDIHISTFLCARYQANPKEAHLIAVKRIFKYLKGTPNLGLWYPKCSGLNLKGYPESDYAGCNMDMKSTSAEVEYIAAAGCCANILWMKSQLTDYDIIYEKESSSQNPSSPNITPKEEPDTQKRPKSPNPFLLVDHVEFTFDEITFSTNNEVALLYPSHPNSEYFEIVSDFISKCCLKEAFTRAPNQYVKYLAEFWYTAKTLEGSKIWVSTPTGEGSPRQKATSESKTKASKSKTGQYNKETQSSSAKDKSPSHPLASTLVVAEMHKEALQAAGGPTSLGTTSEEEAHPWLTSGTNLIVLVDKTKSTIDGLKTSHTNLGINEESRSDEIFKKIKLEDLSNLMQDTRSAFFTLDSPQDEPIIILDESEEE